MQSLSAFASRYGEDGNFNGNLLSPSKRREFFIYFKVASRITGLIMTLEFESPYSKRLHNSLLD